MYIGVMIVSIFLAGDSLQEGASLYARYYSWFHIFRDYFLKDLGSIHTFFGYGLFQFKDDFSPQVTYWSIDNSSLAIFVCSGLIGVIIFISWMVTVFRYLITKFYANKDLDQRSNIRAIIMLFTIYFVGGAMNVNIYDIFFVLPLLFLLKKTYYTLRNTDKALYE